MLLISDLLYSNVRLSSYIDVLNLNRHIQYRNIEKISRSLKVVNGFPILQVMYLLFVLLILCITYIFIRVLSQVIIQEIKDREVTLCSCIKKFFIQFRAFFFFFPVPGAGCKQAVRRSNHHGFVTCNGLSLLFFCCTSRNVLQSYLVVLFCLFNYSPEIKYLEQTECRSFKSS